MNKYHVLLLSLGILCGCSTNQSVSSNEVPHPHPQSPLAQQDTQNQNGGPAFNENQSKKQVQQQTPSNQPIISSQVKQSNSSQNENRYEIAGIKDPKAFEKFFMNLQMAVEQSDKKKVANAVFYPIHVIVNGKKTPITSAGSFIQNYDQIMTPQIKKAIMNQKIQEAFVRDQGVMVGNHGEMWLGISNNDAHKFYIIAINNDIPIQ